MLTSNLFAGDAKEAWSALVEPRFNKCPEFAFVENNSLLPNVLIYGDSISIGYTAQIQKNLKGKANIYRIYTNGGDSKSFIPKMTKMHEVMRNKKNKGHWTFDWNIIHFNIGLHDLKYIAGKKLDIKNGKQVTSINVYAQNLQKILAYLKELAPKAKIVFATTTPVPEGGQGRVAGDAARYNAAALKVMKNHPEIAINDLFNFTKHNHEKWWIKPADVHYNTVGQNAQGDEVSKIILKLLG